jgi:hypothetical protein
MRPVFSSARYGIVSKKMDTAEIFLVSVWKPWLRWPPCGRSRPMMRSCGCNSAVYTYAPRSACVSGGAAPHCARGPALPCLEVSGRAGQRLHVDAPLGGVQAEGLQRALLAQAAVRGSRRSASVAPRQDGRGAAEPARGAARGWPGAHRSAMSMNSLPP